jgi:hypothetical protein
MPGDTVRSSLFVLHPASSDVAPAIAASMQRPVIEILILENSEQTKSHIAFQSRAMFDGRPTDCMGAHAILSGAAYA